MSRPVLDTDARRREFAEAWRRGERVRDIAGAFGFGSPGSVSQAARRLGLPGRNRRDGGDGPLALTGGEWRADGRGVLRWVPR